MTCGRYPIPSFKLACYSATILLHYVLETMKIFRCSSSATVLYYRQGKSWVLERRKNETGRCTIPFPQRVLIPRIMISIYATHPRARFEHHWLSDATVPSPSLSAFPPLEPPNSGNSSLPFP